MQHALNPAASTMTVKLIYVTNLHPCLIAMFPRPTSPALFVTVQLYVPKSVIAERFNSKLSDCSASLAPVFSLIQTYVPIIPGFVFVTLQKSVVDPPRATFEAEATTSTSGEADM